MSKIIDILDKITKEVADPAIEKNRVTLGEKFVNEKKSKIKNCIIASHLTRKTITLAIEKGANLIITIYPPAFTNPYSQSLFDNKLEFLEVLLEKKIAVYSLGEEWLYAHDGGFAFLLELLDFQYSQKTTLNLHKKIRDRKGKIVGCLGEREKKITLKDLVEVLNGLMEDDFIYYGYNQKPIQSLIVLGKINSEQILFSVANQKNIDAIIVGELKYEVSLVINLIKKPIIIIGQRILDNLILGKIRRKIMEELEIDLPNLIVYKQEEIGTYVKK